MGPEELPDEGRGIDDLSISIMREASPGPGMFASINAIVDDSGIIPARVPLFARDPTLL